MNLEKGWLDDIHHFRGSPVAVKAFFVFGGELDRAFSDGVKRVIVALRTFFPGKNLVPRWRTKTQPGWAFSPSNNLTPNLFDWESRPSRVDPAALVCANVV